MYRGKRDDHLTIRVPQANCFEYDASSGETFIEVMLPGYRPDAWFSFMVKPDQVFYDGNDPEHYNIIEGINRNTQILVSRKRIADGRRVTIDGSTRRYDPKDLQSFFS